MKSPFASVRDVGGFDRAKQAVWTLEAEWRCGQPRVEEHWARHKDSGSLSLLVSLIKTDLRYRYESGDAPAVAEYLERFPDLRAEGDRVLSLIYEEFCLREERGERLDPEQFCDRYPMWRDSLASQLRYHQMLSRVVGTPPPRFPEPGERFEQFEIVSALGQGGAGRVFLARDESLGGRKVALKISADRGQEPMILGRLDHPHIVAVHKVVDDSEMRLRGLCMPYRPGLPLDEVIRQVAPSSRPRTARALWGVVARRSGPLPPPADPAGMRSRSAGASPTPSPGSSPRLPGRWPTPTRRRSSTATSSPPTCS